jgi:hypothetical protein
MAAISKIISLIYVAPGIPILYLRNTDTKDENGINTRKKRIAISKIEILEIDEKNLSIVFGKIMENRKKSCE